MPSFLSLKDFTEREREREREKEREKETETETEREREREREREKWHSKNDIHIKRLPVENLDYKL